jgi:uncharacterized surface protein with fasciclin (FAS1) repeats
MKNIFETATGNSSFAMFTNALKADDLIETLSGSGPFTVLAPTEEAFSKIDPETLKALMEDKPKLIAVLKHHVIAGKIMAQTLGAKTDVVTLQGDTLKIDTANGIRIDGAKVISPDIECTNGVIHAIDTVLIQ